MPRLTDRIRIKVVPRESAEGDSDPRESFWKPLREEAIHAHLTPSVAEGLLCRQFGVQLREYLISDLRSRRETLESGILPRDVVRGLHFWRRSAESASIDHAYDALSRMVEQCRLGLHEDPSHRAMRERIVAAQETTFSTAIADYGSLSFDVSAGPLRQLAKAFDRNFDAFRVFLDAFVPSAFAGVFHGPFADRHEFSVHIPSSFEQAFLRASDEPSLEETVESPTAAGPALRRQTNGARARTEWLWWLANGSLLIPFVLAIVVMFYGVRLISEISSTRHVALEPILRHQLELLKEDRLRMAQPPASPRAEPPKRDAARRQDTKDEKK